MQRLDLRNVAIIAHVDHGKTTLVDQMLKQSGTFRENQVVQERVMDSNDLEKERGITILAKNTSVHYKNTKINIIDTPGHADFGGEVERVLKMVNGVLLLVDAAEGPMPQTRFVMQKALEFNHKLIIVINKVDRPDARIKEVEDEILELLIDLNATDSQIDSPIVYCSGRAGTASRDREKQEKDLTTLFECILNHVPAMEVDMDAPLQILVSSIDYNEYVGRIGIGRVERGIVKANQQVAVVNYNQEGQVKKSKIVNLYQIEGLNRTACESAKAGDIVCFSGLEKINIGDTVCATDCVEPHKFVKITEPTVEMTFSVNDSPFAGREGKFVTSRQLRDRLFRETLKDVSLRVSGPADTFREIDRCGLFFGEGFRVVSGGLFGVFLVVHPQADHVLPGPGDGGQKPDLFQRNRPAGGGRQVSGLNQGVHVRVGQEGHARLGQLAHALLALIKTGDEFHAIDSL